MPEITNERVQRRYFSKTGQSLGEHNCLVNETFCLLPRGKSRRKAYVHYRGWSDSNAE